MSGFGDFGKALLFRSVSKALNERNDEDEDDEKSSAVGWICAGEWNKDETNSEEDDEDESDDLLIAGCGAGTALPLSKLSSFTN